MYLRLFAKPSIALALAAYLIYWSGSAVQHSTSVYLKPMMEAIVQGAAYFSLGLLALSAFGFIYGGYRIWRWQNGEMPFCTRCGSMMEIRNGRYGEFWGCMSYPRCRGSEDI
jgi:hypothetical protein